MHGGKAQSIGILGFRMDMLEIRGEHAMQDLLKKALTDPLLVQSFSGVRTVLGKGPGISEAHFTLVSAYGACYALHVLKPGQSATFLIGRDPRPTGSAVLRALVKGFLAAAKSLNCELEINDLGIITTPLAETAVRSLEADGGVMITASHNPLEHNGFKFFSGCAIADRPDAAPTGALLSAPAMGEVIASVAALARGEIHPYVWSLMSDEAVDQALTGGRGDTIRVQAERAYLDVIGEDWDIVPHCLKPLTLGPALLDPNGGAGCGIDARVLEHFGVKVIEINAEQGYPEHGIDTDGIDPASGRHMLLRVARAAARERAHFGVAFDYDADRGNLVLPGHNESAIIAPQQVAAFNISLALARRQLNNTGSRKLAVVLSDATSLASERVARTFGAEVHFVETGEINVVTKMHQLRKAGYDVPVGVEGANGGTIFETSTCRDGLQAALSAALAEFQPEVSREWMRIASKAFGPIDTDGESHLHRLIDAVPENPNVMLRLSAPPMSHAELKANVEKSFADKVWPELQSRFTSYRFMNFENLVVSTERSGEESGGWRVIMESPDKGAFVFLRGSRTESGVWRMIVDADEQADYDVLLPLAKSMFPSAE
jgi:phosphomannomutase